MSLTTFASAHPEMQVEIPESLPERPPVATLKPQLEKLSAAVDQVIKQSPASPFHLGTVNVVVTAENSTPALVSDNIDHTQIYQHNFLNIAKAFDYLPGVSLEHSGPRNEAIVHVRGVHHKRPGSPLHRRHPNFGAIRWRRRFQSLSNERRGGVASNQRLLLASARAKCSGRNYQYSDQRAGEEA